MPDHHQYCTGGFSPDDIVISGIAGRFPECKSLKELQEGLLSQKNFLIPNNDRYEKGTAELPYSSVGTIKELDKFDAEFFGYTMTTANNADPTQRLLLEVSYEAMADAGYEAKTELRGAKIGVYTAITNEDGKEIEMPLGQIAPSFGPGHLRCMNANRVSHVFDFHGPSFTVDAACSSGLVAMWAAFNDIRDGRVEAAVVNAGELCLSPLLQNLFLKVGILSHTAESNPFDERANGIVRTEAVTALFVQKASAARRAYATIIEMQHRAAGYVPEGVYVPSFKEEAILFQDLMLKTKISADVFQFIEAHGTGTQVGDPIEVNAIAEAFCKGRDKPLYIGSVKSNVGHSEAAAGQTGTIKTIFAFESGLIAPNRDFRIPNPYCMPILDGRIKIVTEPLPLTADYIPVNSFGFGGSILQAILKRNPVEYSSTFKPPDLPRLVLYSATTKEAVLHLFEYIEEHPDLRDEFFALMNKLSFAPTLLKPFRGYAIFQDKSPITQIKNSLRDKKRQVWFVITGMGCQWPGMGLDMMQIKIFAESMKKSAAVLKCLGIDLFELLKKEKNYLLTNRSITPAFVCICAIQIALIDVLRALEIYPDGIIGHSTGEIACAYADGCCTAEQTLLSAYWRGKSVELADLVEGEMAAVGLTWEEAVQRCPKGVHPVCHNAKDSVTISGLKEPLEKFVEELQKQNIFARVVTAYGYAFHCEYVWPAAKALKNVLSEVIPKPQARTERWVSTSYPEDKWSLDECKRAGADYFVNNLMSVVRFHDGVKKIPSDALIIEIGPHFLLQSVLKRTIGSDAMYIGLMKKNCENNIEFFLNSLGKLYIEELNPKVENLYRPVKFPVPRNTPMICDLIKWDHSQSFHVPVWKPTSSSFTQKFLVESTDSYLLDHFIDGRALFPATGYIYLAWTAFAKKMQKNIEDIDVIIDDFKIHRPIFLSPATMTFNVTILDSSGQFEIMQSNSLVATGQVHKGNNTNFTEPSPEVKKRDSPVFISGGDIYNELRIHGYEYGPAFRKLSEVSLDGKEGFVEWNDNWITFMDALLLFYMFSYDKSSFLLPTGVHSIKICPQILKSGVEESMKNGLPGLPVNYHADSKICRTIGLEIKDLSVDVAPQQIKQENCIFEAYKFVPYVHKYVTPEKSHKLEKYKIACNKFIEAFERNSKQNSHIGKFSVKQPVDFNAYKHFENSKNGYHLLESLKELADVKSDTAHVICKDIFNRFIQNIGKDFINTLLFNDHCLRLMFDIISENSYRKTSVLEVNNNFVAILPTVVNNVEKFSLLKFKTRTFTCRDMTEINKEEFTECKIQLCSYDALHSSVKEKSQGVIVSAICISTIDAAREHLQLLTTLLEPKGFVLVFHKNTILPPENLIASVTGEGIPIVPQTVVEQLFEEKDLLIVSKIYDGICGALYLLRHAAETESRKIIHLSKDPTWLDELKQTVCETTATSWIVSEGSPTSGIIGMINCLRHEPGGDKIRCIFMPEPNKEKKGPPQFNFENQFYQDILKKDLVVNVYKDGTWGSYRHIRTKKEVPNVEVDHSYVNMKKYGDLSSMMWMESALKYSEIPSSNFVHIYYSALNFKDVMLATAKISVQTEKEVDADKCLIGLEYSGRSKYGERIAGIIRSKAIATAAKINPELSFVVPDEWTLEEAATVPVVYITCYYALIMQANLEAGESILIHSGTGGVGQAAINLALSMDCEVYTTVGTEEKRQYLLKHFPRIKPENIGCSRDTSFEQMITKRTNGKGVDVVLNSLADEKFLASIRCVAAHGRFVEIGKYDLAMDRKIGLKFFLNNVSFHGVTLDPTAKFAKKSLMRRLMGLLRAGIKSGVVKPLNRVVFQRDEVEKAFRYMSTGTHIGKVLIKIRGEEKQRISIPSNLSLPAVPVTYFYPYKVYIIIGGLGGFGIEVCNWLLEKGAKNIALTTRYGARTPYHHFCLKRWKDQGFNITVSTKNVSFKNEALELIEEAQKTGPVGGIFNSAVVLHDAFLENTDWDKFKEVCAPKTDATENLDTLSKELCPELDHFVCFSSISCGRGNAGQMNYGYANSVMERICEKRKSEGLPGLAIQWGIIGDVGVVHRQVGDDAMIAGVGAQRVKSCLRILDLSCQLKEPVVCSYVIGDPSKKGGELGDPLQQLARIFGLKDPSEFNTVRTLGEMGVDSMAAIEVKHLLESTCNASLTMQEIQELKIDDVKSLIDKAENEKKKSSPSTTFVSTICSNLPSYHPEAVQLLNNVQKGTPIFIVDIDSYDITPLRRLAVSVKAPAYALLLAKDTPTTDAESLSRWYLEKMHEIAKKESHIISYSSSSILAFEMMLQSHKIGQNILTFMALSGSSSLTKILNKENISSENDILCEFVSKYIPTAVDRIREELANASTLEQKLRCVVDLFTMSSTQAVNKMELTGIILAHLKKTQLLEKYIPQQKLNKDVLLLEDSSALLANDVAELKNTLSELCSGKITVQRIPDLNKLNEDAIQKIAAILNTLLSV